MLVAVLTVVDLDVVVWRAQEKQEPSDPGAFSPKRCSKSLLTETVVVVESETDTLVVVDVTNETETVVEVVETVETVVVVWLTELVVVAVVEVVWVVVEGAVVT